MHRHTDSKLSAETCEASLNYSSASSVAAEEPSGLTIVGQNGIEHVWRPSHTTVHEIQPSHARRNKSIVAVLVAIVVICAIVIGVTTSSSDSSSATTNDFLAANQTTFQPTMSLTTNPPSKYPTKGPIISATGAPTVPMTSDPTAFPTKRPTLSLPLSESFFFPLGLCTGDCDNDEDCEEGLVCFQRDSLQSVPGCEGGELDVSQTDYCVITTSPPTDAPIAAPTNPPLATPTRAPTTRSPSDASKPELIITNIFPLAMCEGDCDNDQECQEGLVCFQREPLRNVPGCIGGDSDRSGSDYCVLPTPPPTWAPTSYTGPLPELAMSQTFPLGVCQGDCDSNDDCQQGHICFQRDPMDPVPGCAGSDLVRESTDFCVRFEAAYPTGVSYIPGKLVVRENGLLLSQGLRSRMIARSGELIHLNGLGDGVYSSIPFHNLPDGASVFSWPETDGWMYVSNSEVQETGGGGVSAIYFDKDGKVVDFQRLLTGTTANCSGGRTPWNTWVSCEEHDNGNVYQVDPYGIREAEMVTMDTGAFEAFAYDVRDPSKPRFFVTEDAIRGSLRRMTPDNPNWDDPWSILHGPGTVEYTMLNPYPDDPNRGTFNFTTDREEGKQNTVLHYQFSEGLDVYNNQLFITTKKSKELFILNLDDGTYEKQSTVSGAFDGMPDQVRRIAGTGLLYMCEEAGRENGIHARDENGWYFTIFETDTFSDESTGLAFSPDGKHMYAAFQHEGKIFDIWREDGLPFHGRTLNVRYHHTE